MMSAGPMGVVSVRRALVLSAAADCPAPSAAANGISKRPCCAVCLSNSKGPARQHRYTRRTRETCICPQPIFTDLCCPATLSEGGVQRYHGLMHGQPLARPASSLSIGSARETFHSRLQAWGGAAAMAESSRRTRRIHIRTRSCTARWSCFPTSIHRPDPAVGRLALPDMPVALTHTCISRGRVGKPVRRCGDGKYGRTECRPEALDFVSDSLRLCHRPLC